ncbi:hypothetical protein PJP10_32315, partial [Mycobacterium kansasii]
TKKKKKKEISVMAMKRGRDGRFRSISAVLIVHVHLLALDNFSEEKRNYFGRGVSTHMGSLFW